MSKKYRVPNKPSMVILNLWSNGGLWSGNMTVGSSVFMGIEWIELAYNISGHTVRGFEEGERNPGRHHLLPGIYRQRGKEIYDRRVMNMKRQPVQKRKKCQVVCRIDDVRHVGHPEVV
jgi:hypothetical protein